MPSAGWCDRKDFWRLCVSAAMLTLGTTTFVGLSFFTKNLGNSIGEVQMHFSSLKTSNLRDAFVQLYFFRQRCAWVCKMSGHFVSHSLAGSCVHSRVRAVLLHNKMSTWHQYCYLSRAISHVCRIQRLSSRDSAPRPTVSYSLWICLILHQVVCLSALFSPAGVFFLNWPKFTSRNQIVLKGILWWFQQMNPHPSAQKILLALPSWSVPPSPRLQGNRHFDFHLSELVLPVGELNIIGIIWVFPHSAWRFWYLSMVYVFQQFTLYYFCWLVFQWIDHSLLSVLLADGPWRYTHSIID